MAIDQPHEPGSSGKNCPKPPPYSGDRMPKCLYKQVRHTLREPCCPLSFFSATPPRLARLVRLVGDMITMTGLYYRQALVWTANMLCFPSSQRVHRLASPPRPECRFPVSRRRAPSLPVRHTPTITPHSFDSGSRCGLSSPGNTSCERSCT